MTLEVRKRVKKAREPDLLDIKTDIAIAKFEQFGPQPARTKGRKPRDTRVRKPLGSANATGVARC